MQNILPLIKDFKRIILSLFLILTFGYSALGQSTAQVSINVNILPPYSPYYSDYSGTNAGKVLLTVRNLTATQKRIKLTGELKGDNGIRITTKSTYVPLQPIILQPNETKQLNGTSLKDIFDLNSLNVYGIDKVKLVQTSRIPEGNYSFCIQAVDMNTNQVITNTAPQGCTNINISYPDAPVLISPMDGQGVNATFPQSVTFNWINAGFVAPGVQYIFQIAPMPFTSNDPNLELNKVSFPLVTKTVSSTSTILSPSDLQLKLGKRYAWRVKIIDPTGKTVFKNGGISKANQFRYGPKTNVPSVVTLTTPKNDLKIKTLAELNKLEFAWTLKDNSLLNDPVNLPGDLQKLPGQSKLYTKYAFYIKRIKPDSEVQAEKKKSMFQMGPDLSNSDNGIVVGTNDLSLLFKNNPTLAAYVKDENVYQCYVEHIPSGAISNTTKLYIDYTKAEPPYSLNLAGTIKYNFFKNYNAQKKEGFSLANKTLKVQQIKMKVPVKRIISDVEIVENGIKKIYKDTAFKIDVSNNLTQWNAAEVNVNLSTTVASGTTDANGNFKIDVPITPSLYQFEKKDIVEGKYPNNYFSVITNVLVVHVDDIRFSDPNWVVHPDRNQLSVVLPNELVQAYDYDVNVKMSTKSQRDYKGKLYLLRNEERTVLGEGDQILGQSIEIPLIDVNVKQTDNPGIEYAKGKTKYTVVSSKEINVSEALLSSFNFTFNSALISFNVYDNYVVHFKPDDSQDALYFYPIAVKSVSSKKQNYTSTFFKKTTIKETAEFGPKYLTMRISGTYKYQWKDQGGYSSNIKPLPKGTELWLCKGTLGSSFIKDGTQMDDKLVLAKANVGDGGKYSFDLGLIDYENFNKDTGKSMVILVNNPYYYAQPTIIAYNQKEEVQMPELVANVKQFKIESVIVNKDTQKPIPAMTVYLLRKKSAMNFLGLPTDEGDPNRSAPKKQWIHKNEAYEVLDRTESLGNGKFSFNRLAINSATQQDEYFIASEPKTGSPDNYITDIPFPMTGVLRLAAMLGTFFTSTDYAGERMSLFNDQQKIYIAKYSDLTKSQYVPVIPQEPYIEGSVYPYSNTSTTPLAGVLVELFSMKGTPTSAYTTEAQIKALNNKLPIKTEVTESNGRFNLEKFPFGPGSGWYLVRFTKNGFMPNYINVSGGAEMLKGTRADLKVLMELPKTVYADIVGPNNEAVASRIIVGNDFSWTDSKSMSFAKKANGEYVSTKEMATMLVPKGAVKITIIPDDKVAYKTTVRYIFVDANSGNMGNLKVEAQQHHINVRVINANSQAAVDAKIYVTNIEESITVKQQPGTLWGSKSTELFFVSPGNQFNLKVVPTGNYTIAKTQVKSDGLSEVEVEVYVYPATKLTFTAYKKDPNKKVVGSFAAYLEGFEEDEYEKVMGSTSITFNKLPIGKYITGGISAKGFVGSMKSKTVNQQETWDLELRPLAVSFPEKIHGFTVRYSEVKSFHGDYTVSGQLWPAGNAAMSEIKPDPDKKQWLTFTDLPVKVVENKTLKTSFLFPQEQVVFQEHEMDALLYDAFRTKITTKQGLFIESDGTGGSIVGYVALDLASLAPGLGTSTDWLSGDKNSLFLNEPTKSYAVMQLPGQKTQLLNTMSTNNTSQVGKTMKLSTFELKKPTFYGVDDVKVSIDGDAIIDHTGIKFEGIVETDLIYAKTKNILGKASFTINKIGFSSSNEKPITIDLNKWKMEISNWKLNKGGLNASKGILNALGLTIPFTDLNLTYNKIGFGNFDVKSLKILNAFPITFNSNDIMTSFGYDGGFSKDGGAWSVSVLSKSNATALGSLKGLPDINPNDAIQIQNISLYDTGSNDDTRIILKDGQPPVRMNNVALFSPTAVWGGSDFMTFRGKLDLAIPNLNGLDLVTYDLKYQNNSGKLKHVKSEPFKNLYLDVNGIKVTFENDTLSQSFTNGLLSLKGILTDKDPSAKYNINVLLEKNEYGTKVSIPTGKQIIYLNQKLGASYLSNNTGDGSYLDNAAGSMAIANNTWSNFAFSGDLTGSTGVTAKNSKMNFTIKGDIVADKQKVGVQNMDMGDKGVSGINFTYDFVTGEFKGSAHIEQVTPKFTVISDIQLKLGSKAWHIFGNGIVKNIENSPITQAGAVVMVGDDVISTEQRNAMHKHFLDGFIPENFDNNMQKVQGVVTVFSAEMPIPILPSWDIDLSPVLKTTFKHGIVLNMYNKFTFSTDPTKIGYFIGSRIGGYVKVSAAASIGLACAGVGLEATALADANMSIEPLNPKNFNAAITLTFDLKGHAYVGAGVCDSDCETACVDLGWLGEVCSPIPCFKHSVKGQLTMVLGGTIDKNGIHLANPLKATANY